MSTQRLESIANARDEKGIDTKEKTLPKPTNQMPQPSDPQSIHNSYLGEAALFEPNDFTPERPRLALTDEEKAEEVALPFLFSLNS